MARKAFFLMAVVLVAMAQGPARADKGREHQAYQSRPIELGTSGGSIDHIDGAWCCGGTLGGLLQDEAGNLYILSNNHVIARTNRGVTGEDIIQPGLIDVSCRQLPDDIIADLTEYVPIDFDLDNLADAAIAQIRAGQVDASGSILDIGLISSNTVTASLDQKVKKSGRTTGLTTGTVAAIGVTVDVGYSDECGGPTTKVARFVNQFLIRPGRFSAGGDSGSLIVEADDVDPDNGLPRAAGLLFAGSFFYTVANPIDPVLSELGVTMVGGTAPPPPPPPPPPSPGTGTIAGVVTVKTPKGPGIEGATVSVDTGQSAITGADGTYTITDVPTGERSITASAEGFKSQTKTATVDPDTTTTVNFALKSLVKGRGAAINRARNVKARHGARLFEIPGVVGHGIGLSKAGRPVIEVYLEDDLAKARAQIPAALDGVPVRVLVTGPFEAF